MAEGTSIVSCPSGDDSQYCVYPGDLARVGSVQHFLKYSADLHSLPLACEDLLASLGTKALAVAINAAGPNNATLLHAAIVLDHGTRVTTLLAAGADISYKNRVGFTCALDLAIDNGSVGALTSLVDWCIITTSLPSPEGGELSAADVSTQPRSLTREPHPFGHFGWGHRIVPSPRATVGLRALADHPHLRLAVRPLSDARDAIAYIAGAAGRINLLEEELQEAPSARAAEKLCIRLGKLLKYLVTCRCCRFCVAVLNASRR